MGTHPIFESDFDCLTEIRKKEKGQELSSLKKEQQLRKLEPNAKDKKKRKKKLQQKRNVSKKKNGKKLLLLHSMLQKPTVQNAKKDAVLNVTRRRRLWPK